MNIGLDLHGVISAYPKLFERMSRNLKCDGHKVFIITGQEWDKAEVEVRKYKISYTDHYSIVDHHRNNGTRMWKDRSGGWCIKDSLWVRSKGDFICEAVIDIHFDDTIAFAKWIPKTCTFVLVPPKNFDKVFSNFSY